MRTELLLPYPPSVNNLFATNRVTGRRFKSAEYAKWIHEAGWMVLTQTHHHHRHKGKVKFTLLVRKPADNRKRDIANLEKAVADLLVLHRILADDSQIEESQVKWVYEGITGAKVIIEDIDPPVTNCPTRYAEGVEPQPTVRSKGRRRSTGGD